MKNTRECFAVRASVAAVRVALVAMALAPVAYAAGPDPTDPAVAELTRPTNTVEAGAGYVSQDSFKFGQYNGLYNKGWYGIFNLDWSGGAPYDSDSAARWRIYGTNLGLTDRTVYGEYADQGTFKIWGLYDQLRSNYGTGDSYQTPFQGAGSNVLTLPKNWVKPIVPQVSTSSGNFRALSPTTGFANALTNGVLTPPTTPQQATVANIIANDVPDFQNVELDVMRKIYAGGFSYNIDRRWTVAASASQTQKDGLKPLSMINLSSGTVATILPNLIDQTTNQYNVSLNYAGQDFFMTAAYYGSYFTNNVDSMTWDNAFNPGTSATQSNGAPSNEFNQFTLKGGYNFSPTTKLVMGASYGRATQNEAYLNDPVDVPLGTPVSSLNGLVETTQFNARLSAKPMKDLNVNVGYRYLDRDNKTPVNIYEFYDAGEAKSGTSPFNATMIALGLVPPNTSLGSNINIYANRPYSKKVNTFNADAAYAIAPGQSLKGDYEYDQTDRSCPGSWVDCADANKATENTVRLAWDATMLDTVSGRLSYQYSQRRVDYNPNAWLALVPMANYTPSGGATTSVYDFLTSTGLGGYGPNAPYVALQPGNLGIFFPNNSALPQALYGSRNDIHEIPGMMRFNMADRDRNKVRGSVNWDVTSQVGLQGNIEYTDDNYSNSVYGLTNAKNFMANVEGNFAVSENFNANLFYTYEEQRAQSAGISYSAGSITNTATVGGVAGNTVVSGGCFSTVIEKNMNAKIDPCLNWATDMKDKVNTIGGGFTWKGLLGGKLDLIGNLLYSDARTDVGVTGGTYANNPYAVAGKPAVNPAVIYINTQNLPTVSQKMIELQIGGQYAIDKQSAIRAFYSWQKLRVNDYAYDGLQYGTITSVMPTNEQVPNYNVSVVGLSYIYRWR